METRNYQAGASASPPSLPASPSNGYPSNGNPGTGTPATQPGAHWFYKIGEELRGLIVAAGLTPSDADLTQLVQAIGGVASAAEAQAQTNNVNRITPLRLKEAFKGGNQSLASSGYQRLPGDLILQWGITGNVASDASFTVTFPISFITDCFVITPSVMSSAGSNDNYALVISKSATQAVIARGWFTGMAGEALPLVWLAIGK
jgi:hypothetical protein